MDSKSLLPILFFCLMAQCLIAQNIYQRIAKRITPNNTFPEEEIFAMDPTSDGGFIMAGHSNNTFGIQQDMYLVKISATGTTEWMRSYGEAEEQQARDVKQTLDGGYIMVGRHHITQGNVEEDVLIVKTNSVGDIMWTKRYGSDNTDGARSVFQTDDEGYIITGVSRTSTWTNIYLLKIDQNGNFEWHTSFGEELLNDVGYEVAQTTDGGFIVAGDFANNFDQRLYLIKTDENGNQTWAKTYDGGFNAERCRDVKQTADGGFILTGQHQDTNGTGDKAYLVKTDANGNLEWSKKYNRPQNQHSIAYAVAECSTGGYIFTGSTDAGFGSADVLITKVDETGNVLWAKGIGDAGGEEGFDVIQNADGGFTVAGSTIGSFGQGAAIGQLTPFIIKTDANGNSGGCNDASIVYTAEDVITTVENVTDGAAPNLTLIALDITSVSYTPNDSLLCGTTVSVPHDKKPQEIRLYPNPSNGTIHFDLPEDFNQEKIQIKVLNSLGREVNLASTIRFSNNSISLNANKNLAEGIYFVLIATLEKKYSGKIVISY